VKKDKKMVIIDPNKFPGYEKMIADGHFDDWNGVLEGTLLVPVPNDQKLRKNLYRFIKNICKQYPGTTFKTEGPLGGPQELELKMSLECYKFFTKMGFRSDGHHDFKKILDRTKEEHHKDLQDAERKKTLH
jgi:hypothetical protein